MVRPAELPARIQAALRDGLDASSLELMTIRAGDTFATAQRRDEPFEGVAALDLTITDAPGAVERVLPVVVKAGRDAREVDVYRRFSGPAATHGLLPAFYGAHIADEETLLVIERIQNAIVQDTADDVAAWHPPMRWRMIDALAPIHASGLGQAPAAERGAPDAAQLLGFIDAGRRRLPRIVTPEVHRLASGLVDTIGDWYPPGDALPRTLVHGDFTVRNLCFRADRTPVAYDWAHAGWDMPQRDLVDLLASTLQPGAEQAALREPVERHRLALGRAAGVELDPDAWQQGFRIQLRLGLVDRVARQWAGAAGPYLARLTAVTTELLRRMS